MFEVAFGIPIFLIAGIIQVSIFGNISLLGGRADLMLLCIIAWSINDRTKYSWILVILSGLIMSYLSAMPMNGFLWMYLVIWGIIRFIKTKIWEMPLILMLFMTILGSLITEAGSLGLLFIRGASIRLSDAVSQIIIPSLGLNVLLSIPVYALLNDVVNTIYIREETE